MPVMPINTDHYTDPFGRDFFTRPTRRVADDILGTCLTIGEKRGIITETESYIGEDDPACHACFGKTERTKPMYEIGGHLYVYLIYGIHHCANIITEDAGYPAGVLIRGIIGSDGVHYDGPGKLSNYLNLSRVDSGRDIITDPQLSLHHGVGIDIAPDEIKHTPRIGISAGVERRWRSVVSSDITSKIQQNIPA